MAKYKRKSKAQRRKWWYNLSPEEQGKYIDQCVSKKKAKRDKKDRRIMKVKKLNYNCEDCIHGKTKSCTDRYDNGCTYFWDAINNINGPAYKKTG